MRRLVMGAVLMSSVVLAGDASTSSLWTRRTTEVPAADLERKRVPAKHTAYQLKEKALLEVLRTAPPANENSRTVVVALPLPDGTFADFKVFETFNMAPELAAKYPDIKSYRGMAMTKGVLPTLTIGTGPSGVEINFETEQWGRLHITPIGTSHTLYVEYATADLPPPTSRFSCGTKTRQTLK